MASFEDICKDTDTTVVSNALMDVYTEVCRATPDPRVVNAWTRAISNGSKTMMDFIESLTNRAEYKVSVENRYRQMVEDMISPDAYSQEDFECIYSSFTGSVIRDLDIKKYIRALPSFKQHYTELVQRVYRIISPDVMANEAEHAVVDVFVHKFCEDALYDMDRLHTDMQEYLSATQRDSGNDIRATEEEVKQPGITAECRDASSSTHVDRFGKDDLIQTSQALDLFESVFGRKMFVQEFMMYGHAILGYSTTQLEALRSDFLRAYHLVREVYVAYTDAQYFEEYEFVKLHLTEYKEDGFQERLPMHLLGTPEYEAKMKAKLQTTYQGFYDEVLDEDSVNYLFILIRALKLGVHDGDLPHRVQEFKAETDMIVENIFYVYTTTFERSPEDAELKELIKEYRSRLADSPSSAINADVCVRLMNTLEFHDVIKGKLRSAYTKHTGSSVSAGLLYQLLQDVLKCVASCKKISDVDELVERVIVINHTKN